MKCNLGMSDKVLRAIAGLVIIGLGFYFNSWWGALGVIPIVAAVFGWCPLYKPFRVSTCKLKT